MQKFSVMICAFVSFNMYAMQQLAIIRPFFHKPSKIAEIKAVMDKIQRDNLGYPDYAQRTGLIWTDFNVHTKDTSRMTECKETIKLTEVNGTLQRHNPESMFSYPTVQSIVGQAILPKIFSHIEDNGWAKLPQEVFAQLFIQRCHASQAMTWHQDPGEDFTTMADYSFLLMLSDHNDPLQGWDGGEFRLKPALPLEQCLDENIQTIIPEYNKAMLFNNKYNSHMVTEITTQRPHTKRDLLVITLYFGEMPLPVK